MRSVALSEAKNNLSALVDEAVRTHDIIRITKHGRDSAVIMAAEDLDALQETVEILSEPGAREEIKEARADIAAGNTISADAVMREFGLTTD